MDFDLLSKKFIFACNKLHSYPLDILNSYFYRQSKFVGKHAWKFIITCLSFSIVINFSYLLMRTPTDASGSSKETRDLFTLKNGRYSMMNRQYSKMYNFTIDRKEDYWRQQLVDEGLSVLLTPKDDNQSYIKLDESFWNDAKILCDLIRYGRKQKIVLPPFLVSVWKHYSCAKKNGSCFEPWICNRKDSFVINFDKEMKDFAMNTKLTTPETESAMKNMTSEDGIGGNGTSLVKGVNVTRVHSLLLVWLYYPDKVGFYWDFKTYEYLLKRQSVLKCCKMSLFSHVHFFKEVDDSVSAQTPLFICTIVFMLGFCIAINWKHSMVHSRSSLAIAVILSTFMAIGNGLVTGIQLGIPFIALVSLSPFIILGVGIDSGLILIRSWACDNTHILDPVERTAKAIEKSFTSIFMSDLTSMLAFTIGSFSKYPAVNYACQYLAICLFYLFLVESTFLTACLVIHNKRVNRFKHCICCWDTVAENEEHMIVPCYPKFDLANVSDNSFERDLGKVFKSLVSSMCLRSFVLLITFAFFLTSCHSLYNMKTGAEPDLFILEDSQLRSYLSYNASISRLPTHVAFSINEPLEYWDPNIHKKMNELYSDLINLDFVDENSFTQNLFWLPLFYLENDQNNVTKKKFYNNLLPKFLHRHPNFKRDIIAITDLNGKTTGIKASRFFIPCNFLDGIFFPEEANRRLKLFEKIVSSYQLDITFACIDIDGWESMLAIKESTWRTILVAILTCSVLVFFIIPENRVFICVVITTSAAILSTLGVMAFFGLKYNMLTYTEILISIGLSIDYMSHSGYSFVVEEGTPIQRSEKALGAMGIALTNAALSSIVGFMFLSFTSVYAFKTCFISFITLFVLSFYYGVIFLPTLLSFVGGSKRKSGDILCDDNEDFDDNYEMQTIGNSRSDERHFLADFIKLTRGKKDQPKGRKVKLENEHSDEDIDALLDNDEIEIIY